MATIRQWYGRVNATWPEVIPPLTFEAGANAAQRLHRFVTGENFVGTFVEVKGRQRYSSYPRRGIYPINSGVGWHRLIHDISHYHWRKVGEGERPHAKGHARFELKLVKEVVRRGWLVFEVEPIQVTAPVLDIDPEPQVREQAAPVEPATRANPKLEKAQAAVLRWERKLQRAENALKKARRKVRYYERRGSGPSKPNKK